MDDKEVEDVKPQELTRLRPTHEPQPNAKHLKHKERCDRMLLEELTERRHGNIEPIQTKSGVESLLPLRVQTTGSDSFLVP